MPLLRGPRPRGHEAVRPDRPLAWHLGTPDLAPAGHGSELALHVAPFARQAPRVPVAQVVSRQSSSARPRSVPPQRPQAQAHPGSHSTVAGVVPPALLRRSLVPFQPPGAGSPARDQIRGSIDREPAMDDEAAERAVATAKRWRTEARERVENMSVLLRRTARALESSADLAEEHARQEERSGHGATAADERRAANRARQAAERARSQADEWLQVGSESKRWSRSRGLGSRVSDHSA